jgi:2-octaprenylphenol hydroxylase
MRYDFHIVIVGGGMVGACAAALAAADPHLAELRIAVLEAQPPASPPQGDIDLRVSAVSRASQRILAAVGAWSLVPQQSLSPYEDMVVWDAAGRPRGAGAIHFSASATSEPSLGHIVENRRLQWALYDSPSFRQRITLLRAELADLTFERDRAVVALSDGRTLSAALVIGSDGAASLSRKLAGIETGGWNYDQRAFVTHVRTEHPHARTAWQRFLADGPIAFLPLADGRSSIVWSLPTADAERLLATGDAEFLAELGSASAGVIGELTACSKRVGFALQALHALKYTAPRVALLGDAAHTVHPLAGQGMNLGILDAAALAAVVEDALLAGEDVGDLKVLRRYERERKGDNLAMLAAFDGLNRMFGLPGWAAPLRTLGLRVVEAAHPVKRLLMQKALGLEAGRRHRVRWSRAELQA